jgi:hypothetical protein
MPSKKNTVGFKTWNQGGYSMNYREAGKYEVYLQIKNLDDFLCISIYDFERSLKYMIGVQTVPSPGQATTWIPIRGKGITLQFKEGSKENYQTAHPITEEEFTRAHKLWVLAKTICKGDSPGREGFSKSSRSIINSAEKSFEFLRRTLQ